MKSKILNNTVIKSIAIFVSFVIVCSLITSAPINIAATAAGGSWDYKAYGINKDIIYPQQSTWNWPITIAETDGVATLKYNDAGCTYAYTAAITKISPHNAHISLTVNDADRFFVMFGLKQQHYQLNSVSFKINRTNRSIDVYVGTTSTAQKITTLSNIDIFDNTKDIDIKLSKVSTGYSFSFNGYEYILLTNDFNQYNSYLRGCFDRNDTNIWFNVAPDTTKPKFSFNSIHSGNDVCYDELAKNHTTDEMNALFDTIYSINNIGGQITLESKPLIDVARTSYDTLPESLRKYIHNYDDLLFAEDAYEAALKESVNIDSLLYPVKLNNIGPNIFAGWENKVKFTKADEGVTVEFTEATVHNASLNVSNPLGLDGLHIRFKNCEYVGQGEKFALLFHTSAQIDMTNSAKMLWMTFSVNNTEVTVKVYSKSNTSGTTLISTNQLTKSDMKNWDILITAEEDGSYKFTLNGSLSGIIPAGYITDAKEKGLNIEGLYVTLGYNNLATPTSGSKLKVDCVSAHDKTVDCSDNLYDEYGRENVLTLKEVLVAIESIGFPVTAESGAAIMAAENSYNSLDDDLKKFVTNYDDVIIKRKMYDKLTNGCTDMDYAAHGVKKSDVGPNIYSGWENKVNWYEAESGKGVTIELTNTTVHSVGLNVSKPLSLDGLHVTFAEGVYENQAANFALIFHKMAQIDLTSNAKQLWMTFNLSDIGVKVNIISSNKATLNIINTSYITKSDFEKGWDIKIEKQDDGSYLVTLNGVVTGVIPKEYIDDAVSNGFDVNSFITSLASNNFGNVSYHLKADFVSIHDGKENCYYQVSSDEVLSVDSCEKLIDNIGNVDENSGNAVKIAQNSFNALGEYLQGIVRNRETLASKVKQYNSILKDVTAADKVEKLISVLPNDIDDKSYNNLLKAYFEYLDLYPRARKYVENADVLLNAVKKYESTHKGVNLANESMNIYTKGKTAHYLKELIMNLFS